VSEDRIASRYAQALARGEYARVMDAVPPCWRELLGLRAKLRREGVVLPGRSTRSVEYRLLHKARALGRPARHPRLSPEEDRLVERYARMLVKGRHPSIADAAGACWAAHKTLARGADRQRPAPRTLHSIYQLIEKRSLVLGRPRSCVAWTPDEDRVVLRFARQVVAGEYRSVTVALPDCREALAGLGLGVRHTAHSTTARLHALAHKLGWAAGFRRWTPPENEVADRFARAVLRGKYPRATAATADCARALRRAGLSGRSLAEVRRKLICQALRLGRTPTHTHWSRQEVGILDRFARALTSDRYPSVEAAATACRLAMRDAGLPERSQPGVRGRLLRQAESFGRLRRDRFWTAGELRRLARIARDYAAGLYPNVGSAAAAGLRALGRAGPKGPRTRSGVQRIILDRAHDLGRPKRWRYWTEAENRMCDSWLRWYERHRSVRRYRPSREAIAGFHEELQNAGYDRTLYACGTYFYKRRLRLMGIA
jgi:hypothetical protein